MTKSITIIGGRDKRDIEESVSRVDISYGSIISIVGPTGSGKSTLINDIEQLANMDTSSRRQILVDGEIPSPVIRYNPQNRIVAQLSQGMHFLTDMTVHDFLLLHAKSRNTEVSEGVVRRIVEIANTFCGEAIDEHSILTELSGGQTRALMIADIAVISKSPIVLIDEIENAGIKKTEAINELIRFGKIVIIVTHDPTLALMADRRIVMKNGGMTKILETTGNEKRKLQDFTRLDNELSHYRNLIRQGELIA